MPIKILQLITLGETGGAQRVVESLVRGLAADGRFTVTVAHGPGDDLAQWLSDLGDSVRFIRLKRLRRAVNPAADSLAYSELLRLIRTERFDLVHCHSTKAGILGRLAAATAGVRASVFTAHGWAFTEGVGKRKRAAYTLAERAVARLTDRVLCVSDYDLRLATKARIIPRGLMAVVRNGLDLTPYDGRQPKPTAEGSPIRLCTVGRLAEAKDPWTMVEALRILHQDIGPRFTFDFIGDGPLREAAKALVAKAGLEGVVRFRGNRADVPELLLEEDVFVLSSRWEGLPISVMEAMAAGLPVVATDVGGVSELVEHGVTGLMSARGDPAGLARSLKRLIGERQTRSSFGQAGKARALSSFSADRMVRETIGHYLELVRP